MWWLLILGAIILLGFLPLGFLAFFDQNSASLLVKVGLLRFRVGSRSTKAETEKTEKTAEFESHAVVKKKKKSKNITQYLPLLKPVFEFLSDFKRKLSVNNLQLKVVMGGSDPCDLSVNYGRAWIALGNLMPILDRFFVIKKRNLEIECDFEAEQTLVTAGADITITIGRLVGMLVKYGVLALIEFLKIQNKRKNNKGGAEL